MLITCRLHFHVPVEYAIIQVVVRNQWAQDLTKTSLVNGISSVTLVLELLRAEAVF